MRLLFVERDDDRGEGGERAVDGDGLTVEPESTRSRDPFGLVKPSLRLPDENCFGSMLSPFSTLSRLFRL